MKNSHIEWTDHTFNPWIGCTKVDALCAHCYAEARDRRFADGAHWGPGAPRERTTEANWRQPLRWAAEQRDVETSCALAGVPYRRPRVFSASLADWLDEEVPIAWLVDFLELVRQCSDIDWLLLTKRPENWAERIEAAIIHAQGTNRARLGGWLLRWLDGEIGPANVWVGTSVGTQESADKRIPKLIAIPARVRFLSCEPLLEAMDLCAHQPFTFAAKPDVERFAGIATAHIDWVICGGESGPGARPMHPDWARGLRDQCAEAGVPFFFKQWGEWLPEHQEMPRDRNAAAKSVLTFGDGVRSFRVGKGAAGRLLDGCEHSAGPSVPAEIS